MEVQYITELYANFILGIMCITFIFSVIYKNDDYSLLDFNVQYKYVYAKELRYYMSGNFY